MEALHITETSETPEINLDKVARIFEISGRSLTENPIAFYSPVINWMKEYVKAPNKETVITFKFEYLNIESSKSILDLLNVLEGIAGVKVGWNFSEEDEDMEEIGEELAELVNIPFQFQIQS